MVHGPAGTVKHVEPTWGEGVCETFTTGESVLGAAGGGTGRDGASTQERGWAHRRARVGAVCAWPCACACEWQPGHGLHRLLQTVQRSSVWCGVARTHFKKRAPTASVEEVVVRVGLLVLLAMGLGDAGVGGPHVWAWRPHIGIGSKKSARDPQEEAVEFKK
jgi:hypothetical protein